jgi:hypothetical protein
VRRIATADRRAGRDAALKASGERAMDLKEYQALPENLRSMAFVHVSSKEVFWPNPYVEQVVRALADCDRAILGFDIITIEQGAMACIRGTGAYRLEEETAGRAWRDCVNISLRFAVRDLGRIEALSGLGPPFGNLYYAVVTANQAEYTKLLLLPRTIWV